MTNEGFVSSVHLFILILISQQDATNYFYLIKYFLVIQNRKTIIGTNGMHRYRVYYQN